MRIDNPHETPVVNDEIPNEDNAMQMHKPGNEDGFSESAEKD